MVMNDIDTGISHDPLLNLVWYRISLLDVWLVAVKNKPLSFLELSNSEVIKVLHCNVAVCVNNDVSIIIVLSYFYYLYLKAKK